MSEATNMRHGGQTCGSVVIGVDPAYGASGRTGVDGPTRHTELRGTVAPSTMLATLREHGGTHGTLAVEWPFLPKPPAPNAPQAQWAKWRARAEGALQLAGTATAWATVAALLGWRVLTPNASQWRPWLVAEMRGVGLKAPAVAAAREQWKAAAVALTGIQSDHVAEARCIRRWAERHVAEGLQ